MKVISPTSENILTRRVFVGLSGGVDSATSAALLQKQGYDVTGVFIRIALDGYPCTAGEDKIDAMRVAAHLKIPFLSIDLSEAYKKRVFDLSIDEFKKGRTPNPDMLCNREIKFGLFFEWCMAQGADFVATGHYAQIKDGLLYAGVDSEKDQSYFLALVPQQALARTLFPIGHMQKKDVRTLARKLGLPNAERKDSQGLCFLGPVSVFDMLQRELKLTPGEVLDEKGRVVGQHEGVPAYTLGQRHGFILYAHTPVTPPHYVVAKNIEHNTLTVSTMKVPLQAHTNTLTLRDTNWIGAAEDGPCAARYRYRQTLIAAEKRAGKVLLREPYLAPQGQTLVLYRGERCLGGGVIV